MKTGVEIIGRQTGVHDPYVARQAGIEGTLPVQPGFGLGHVAVGHLPVGVHARIGAARALHMGGNARHVGHGLFQFSLNRGRVGPVFPGLDLPAPVMRAHVGQSQFETGHGRLSFEQAAPGNVTRGKHANAPRRLIWTEKATGPPVPHCTESAACPGTVRPYG